MRILIEGSYQEHASRLCEDTACICVGRSTEIAYVAQYQYKITGATNAGYSDELRSKKIFALVTHHFIDHAVPAGGAQHKRLRRDYTVIEYFKIQPSRLSVPDCIKYTMPFQQEIRCGLSSEVTTSAEIMVLVSGSAPDKSWRGGSGIAHNDKPEKETEVLGPPPDAPQTPRDAVFGPPQGQGDTTRDEVTIAPTPNHCADWSKYLSYSAGKDRYQSKIEHFATRGKWFVFVRGKRVESEKDPEGGGTEVLPSYTEEEDPRQHVLRPVTESDASLYSVGHLESMGGLVAKEARRPGASARVDDGMAPVHEEMLRAASVQGEGHGHESPPVV